MLPSARASSSTAEPWKALGHSSCVFHRGCSLVAPLAAVRLRLSVCGPATARAGAAVSAAAPRLTPISPARTMAAKLSDDPFRPVSEPLGFPQAAQKSHDPPYAHRYGSHHKP